MAVLAVCVQIYCLEHFGYFNSTYLWRSIMAFDCVGKCDLTFPVRACNSVCFLGPLVLRCCCKTRHRALRLLFGACSSFRLCVMLLLQIVFLHMSTQH